MLFFLSEQETVPCSHNKGRGIPPQRKEKGSAAERADLAGDGKVIAYSLAYINLKRCPVDNGRVLGYDNSHGFHHRHFMGKIEPVSFSTYAALVERFLQEVHELWRIEDEER